MNPSKAQVFRQPVMWLACGFGSGLSRWAPGTMGTLVAVPLVWLALGTPPWAYALISALIAVVGVPICGEAARRLGVPDHGGIVWDEIAGLFVTAMPLLWLTESPVLGMALAFAWFRLFDILKPWPIRWLDQQVHGGLGIMLDDLLAGVFAAAALWLSLSWLG